MSEDVRRELTQFSINHMASVKHTALSWFDYERLYHIGTERICDWQYQYEDADDHSELMVFMTLLRRIADDPEL